MSSKRNKTKTKNQTCAWFKVNAEKHLTNHMLYTWAQLGGGHGAPPLFQTVGI